MKTGRKRWSKKHPQPQPRSRSSIPSIRSIDTRKTTGNKEPNQKREKKRYQWFFPLLPIHMFIKYVLSACVCLFDPILDYKLFSTP